MDLNRLSDRQKYVWKWMAFKLKNCCRQWPPTLMKMTVQWAWICTLVDWPSTYTRKTVQFGPDSVNLFLLNSSEISFSSRLTHFWIRQVGPRAMQFSNWVNFRFSLWLQWFRLIFSPIRPFLWSKSMMCHLLHSHLVLKSTSLKVHQINLNQMK